MCRRDPCGVDKAALLHFHCEGSRPHGFQHLCVAGNAWANCCTSVAVGCAKTGPVTHIRTKGRRSSARPRGRSCKFHRSPVVTKLLVEKPACICRLLCNGASRDDFTPERGRDHRGRYAHLERIPLIWNHFSGVMAGLVPAIHVLLAESRQERRGCLRQARA